MERAPILVARRLRLNRDGAATIMLYFVLLAGGLWHVFGILQTTMRLLAAPMIAAVAALLCFTQFRSLRRAGASCGRRARASSRTGTPTFWCWCFFVFAGGFVIEWAGVRTGLLFGAYDYGSILQPMLLRVPLAIGCAWLAMIISSAALAQRSLPLKLKDSNFLFAGAAAGFMVIFDLFMEPAAIKLGYWNWQNGVIPLRNYMAWFAFGFLLAYAGARLHVFPQKLPPVAAHAYLAQMGYFVLVMLS